MRISAILALAASAVFATGCSRQPERSAPPDAAATSTKSAASTATTLAEMPVTVTVSSAPDLHLTDATGHALYRFSADVKGAGSRCDETCAATWHPFEYRGALSASGGAAAALLGSIKRSNGSTQITYDKWPLYYYAKDTAPGETGGAGAKDFGGEWYLVSPQGAIIHTGGSS